MKKKLIGFGIVVLSLLVIFLVFINEPMTARDEGRGGGIALIHVEGVIMGGRGDGGLFGTATATSGTIMRQLREAADDPWVKAVVLRLNTPGGSVPATQEITDELKRVQDAGKIVVVSMGDVAASGGYWLAAHSDLIVANPGTITGSIGVIMNLQNWEELYQKIGIRHEAIKSGEFKDMGSTIREMTPTERELLQEMIDDMYQQFVDVVVKGRELPEEEVLELAKGQIFTGLKAKELGLVDEMGNIHRAIDIAAEKVGLPEDPPVREMGKPTRLGFLFSQLQNLLNPVNFYQNSSPYYTPIPR